jgi:hypothetical protein
MALILGIILSNSLYAQLTRHLSDKVSLELHPNIETYFIAERLSVQHIGYFILRIRIRFMRISHLLLLHTTGSKNSRQSNHHQDRCDAQIVS